MKWILVFCLAVGCAESLSVDAYDLPDGGDVPSDGDTDTEWAFDCERACDAEAICGAQSSTYTGWDVCYDGCTESLATEMNEAQEDAVECVWFECVITSEAGELPCTEWVTCIHNCTKWLFE